MCDQDEHLALVRDESELILRADLYCRKSVLIAVAVQTPVANSVDSFDFEQNLIKEGSTNFVGFRV